MDCCVPLSFGATTRRGKPYLQIFQMLIRQGWRSSKAPMPVLQAFGAALPPPGTDGAAAMKAYWTSQVTEEERPMFDGLQR